MNPIEELMVALRLRDSMRLRGNQRTVYRQLLKTTRDTGIVFVDEVVNFTDLTSSQVRSAFAALIKKGLVENVSNRSEINGYIAL